MKHSLAVAELVVDISIEEDSLVCVVTWASNLAVALSVDFAISSELLSSGDLPVQVASNQE